MLQLAAIAALVVRPAMREHVGHAGEHVGRDRRRRIGPDGSGDSAHDVVWSLRVLPERAHAHAGSAETSLAQQFTVQRRVCRDHRLDA